MDQKRVYPPTQGDSHLHWPSFQGAGRGEYPEDRTCDGVWLSDDIDHLRLTEGTTPPWQVTDKHGTTFQFDTGGKLTQIRDRNGNTLDYAYNSSGQLETITDSFNRTMTLTYLPAEDGGVIDTVRAGSRTVYYTYTPVTSDNILNLTRVDSPDGSFVTYQYDANWPHKMALATDSVRGPIELHAYDPSTGRDTDTSSDGTNYSYHFSYSGNPSVETTVTNGNGVATVYALDPLRGVAVARTSGPGCGSCGDAGNETHKTYDDALNVTDIVDGLGIRTHMTYDARGNVLTRTENCIWQNGECVDDPEDPVSRTTTYTYDDPNNPNLPTTISTPTTGACSNAHKVITNQYSASGNLTHSEISGCNGNQPIASATTYEYYDAVGEHGQLKSVNGPRDDVSDVLDKTTYTYFDDTAGVNDQGRLKQVKNASQQPTNFAEYDLFGNVGKVTDANGVETKYTYNDGDRVTRIRIRQTPGEDSDEDIVTEYEYDLVGNRHRLHTPECVARVAQGGSCDYSFEYQYDVGNQLLEVRDSYGNKIAYEYDTEGNRIREVYKHGSDPAQRETNFEYDDFNQLEKVCYAPSSPTACGSIFEQFIYHADGTQDTGEDPQGHTTTYEYDQFKRLKSSTQHVGTDTLTTSYKYDVQDGLIKVTDPRGLETVYVNDDRGWRTSTVSPDTGTTSYEYDPAGNLKKTTDANGVIVERAYDELNRLTTTTYPDTSLNVTYEYDSLDVPFGTGRRTEMVDPSGTTLYSYDRRGLLTSEEKEIDGLTFATGYDYDKNGNVSEIRYPAYHPSAHQGIVDYEYDAADRVTAVRAAIDGEMVTVVEDVEYKPFGPRSQLVFGSTLVDSRTFDKRYQPTAWTVGGLLSYTNGFDRDGNLTSVTDNIDSSKNRTFGYDEAHRLTSAAGPWGNGVGTVCPGGKTYGYDKNGNRTCKEETSPATMYIYTPGTNRMATSSRDGEVTSYDYNANGSTTTDGTYTYDYSQAGRLAIVDGAAYAGFTYDGENRRVMKSVASISGPTMYFYDPAGRLLTEIVPWPESHSATGKDYLYLPDGVVARDDWSITYHACPPPHKGGLPCDPLRGADALFYYHTDHLGTPIAMTDGSSAPVWRAEYMPFGELFSNTVTTVENNLRFPGQYFDQQTGLHQNWFRDYSPKTGRYQEADPIGLSVGVNPYIYVGANPATLVDPSGLYACTYDVSDHRMTCTPRNPAHPVFNSTFFVSGNNLSPTCTDCQNNPARAGAKFHGPIPAGDYRIEQQLPSSARRPLTPRSSTSMPGRKNFQIHGCGDPTRCSEGCIAATANDIRDELNRDLALEEGDNTLHVQP